MPLIMSKAMKEAQLKVRINKPACYHAFRYPLATHLLENGYDVSTTTITPVPTSGILTKTGEQQILRIFSAEKCRRWKGIYRNLIVAPSAVHLIGGRMIIVSWNCARAFRNKFTFLQNLLPDVCVVQECEDPTRSASDSYREWSANSLWIGDNKNRGLGIFAKPHIRLEPVALDANGLETFLPCRIDGSMTLLGVWTRRTESYDFRYIGQLWKYLNLHAETLRTKTSIVMGDFNSNVIWDKRHAAISHTSVVQQLSNIGLESLYHYAQSVPQGKERDATLFLQRNLKKRYHIDYAFIPKNLLPSSTIEIGKSSAWLKYSDHMPVRMRIDTVL